VLLKLSFAGLFRIAEVLRMHINFVLLLLCALGVRLGALVCIIQRDVKALVAYSSITHINLFVLRFVIITTINKEGAILLAMAHGYTSSLLFFYAGLLVHINNTRILCYLNGVILSHLGFSLCLFLSVITNCGIPPSLAFVSELRLISSSYIHSRVLVLVFLFYVLFVCYYSLYMLVAFIRGTHSVSFNTTPLYISTTGL